jgi:PKD repeat protein
MGAADGGFETGLQGVVTQGDVRLVETLGGLRPTQGTQAVLLSTQPNSGTSPAEAQVSLLRINNIRIPADAEQLRLDYYMLSNEPTPSLTNDCFTVELALMHADGGEVRLQVDTFAMMSPAPLAGYAAQTGFKTLVADLSADAIDSAEVTLVLRLADVGDGRMDSALLLDNLQWVAADEPLAVTNFEYMTVAPGEIVSFDSSGSIDSNGDITEYHWEFGDGTAAVGLFVEHGYAQEGLHQGTLTVHDQAGHRHTDTFLVMVTGTLPVPHISAPSVADETVAQGGQWSIRLDASGSQDDTGIAAYVWDFGDGSNGTGVNPTHTYTAPGAYTVTLTVTDHAGQQATSSFTVVVRANNPPVADAGGPYVVGEAGAKLGVWTVTLDGRNSTDDVAIDDYEWTMQPEVADDFAGTTVDTSKWLVSASITQDEVLTIVGTNSWSTRHLFSSRDVRHQAGKVFQAQIRPLHTAGDQRAVWGLKDAHAAAWYHIAMPYAIEFVNKSIRIYENGKLQGTVNAYAPGVLYDIRIRLQTQGAIYEFKAADAAAWTPLYTSDYIPYRLLKVGGAVYSGQFRVDNMQLTAVHKGPVMTQTYTTPGTYQATLRVRDSALQTDTDTTVIAVEMGTPPVAHAGGPYVLAPDNRVHFTSVASSDDVNIATYLWDFGDGTFSTEANPVHVYATAKTYPVKLTVIDAALQMDTATTTVYVSRITAVDTSGVTVHEQTLEIAGTVSAHLINPDTSATGPFTLTFFDDSNGNGRFDAGVDTIVGSVTHNGIPAGESALVSTSVAGRASFRDAPIYVFLDTGEILAVATATNYADNGQACTFMPPVGTFNPVLEWEWTGDTILPSSQQVLGAPAVVDLTADGIPDVVFTTFSGSSFAGNGHLRAINGNDGSAIFTVTDAHYDVRGASSIAVGDIDTDGRPEILAVDESGSRLIAFEHDGTFKWRSPVLVSLDRGGAAIADVDRDGMPEVVVGATVLNHDGTVRWVGAQGRGEHAVGYVGPLSLVANLDLADDPEIVAGNTAYRSDGSLYWHNTTVSDGFNAVANFDSDPFPEIVLVSQGYIYLLEHDGMVIWGPTRLPGKGKGGAPTVADVDDDGEPEIGVAGATAYTVFEADGTIKWSTPTQDQTSNVTGSAVFDFEGDGSAEIVYSDELMLRIYRGHDGTVLWETPSSSRTVYELPIIVDVDADGNAEIVMVSNNHYFPGRTGIQVYGDANDTWVPTRRIWNQHTYHVTNVHDDGTIPQNEGPSWLGHNTYRLNLEPAGQRFAAPDLTASSVRIVITDTTAELTARVGNGGASLVTAGLLVSFYDGDPSASGVLLGTVMTSQDLSPGAFEDVTLTVSGETQDTVWVFADDDGTHMGKVSECREDNNIHNSGMPVQHQRPPTATAGPDRVVRERCAVGAGATVMLAGEGSDPDTDSLTFVWKEGDTFVAEGATPTVNLSVGMHILELTVTDTAGLENTDTVLITVHKVANLNLDTVVDMTDLLTVITAYGPAAAPGALADVNCNGIVDRDDTLIILSQYDQASP